MTFQHRHISSDISNFCAILLDVRKSTNLLKFPTLRPLVLLTTAVLRLKLIWSSVRMVLKKGEKRRVRRKTWPNAKTAKRNLNLTIHCLRLGSNWTHKHGVCAECTAALCQTWWHLFYPSQFITSSPTSLYFFLDIWSFHLRVVGNLSFLGCYLVSFSTQSLVFRIMFWPAVSGSSIPKFLDLSKLKFKIW